jgi:sterol desaturase/sphingolipid hydroxylase (fatty acid hydroxylase superfamily)
VTFVNFLWVLLSVNVARNLLVYTLTLISRSEFAQKRRIEMAPIKPEQHKRQRFMVFKGTVIDALFGLVFFLLGILQFVSQSSAMEWVIIIGVHFFIVEPVYYAYHRLLHKRWLYKHHHLVHHLSRVTEPPTSFTFTILERISYTVLFALPLVAASLMGYLSVWGFVIYLLVFDFVNSLGHFNTEVFPRWYQKSFLKYLFYTPTFHSRHHTKFNFNYALYVPLWDFLFKTYEPKTEEVFEIAKARKNKLTK